MATDAGLPRPTLIAAFTAIALVGAFAFLVVRWNTAKTAATELRAQIADLDVVLEEKGAEFEPLQRSLAALSGQADLFARGKMCVTNVTDSPVTIQKLSVVYLDENGDFQSFNSGAYGSNLWTIDAGHARQEISYPRGGWDGSVTYFAMWLASAGQDGPQARVWSPDPEFCVRVPWVD